MIVVFTGAPGAGKSTILKAWLNEPLDGVVAFDMDSLLRAGSALASANIQTSRATWPAYNRLWLDVLAAVEANGLTPLLFAPIDERDFNEIRRRWPELATMHLRWLLLDCNDTVRRQRLSRRDDPPQRLAEALIDAAALRATVGHRIDSSDRSASDVLREMKRWLSAEVLPARVGVHSQAT